MAPRGGERPPNLSAAKMTILSFWPVDTSGGRPYNPPIAEDRGAAKRQRLKQASEKQSVFEFQSFKFRVADDDVEKRNES